MTYCAWLAGLLLAERHRREAAVGGPQLSAVRWCCLSSGLDPSLHMTAKAHQLLGNMQSVRPASVLLSALWRHVSHEQWVHRCVAFE